MVPRDGVELCVDGPGAAISGQPGILPTWGGAAAPEQHALAYDGHRFRERDRGDVIEEWYPETQSRMPRVSREHGRGFGGGEYEM